MKILIFSNTQWSIYNFRSELIEDLINSGHDIIVAGKKDDGHFKLKNKFKNIKYINLKLEPRGINIFKEIILIIKLINIVKKIKIDLFLNFTIKPCLYGSIIGFFLKIKIINTITGLGRMFSNKNKFRFLFVFLYKIFLRNSELIVFQNNSDQKFFYNKNILISKNKSIVVNGSGVNLSKFKFINFPPLNKEIKFLMISRILSEKGIDYFLETAKYFKDNKYNLSFSLLGDKEDNIILNSKVEAYNKKKIIDYYGFQDNIIPILEKVHFVVLPTKYNEGVPKSLIEAAASGKPIICSDNSGCKSIVKNQINGFIIPEVNLENLIKTIKLVLNYSYSDLNKMAINSREIATNNFSVNDINKTYLDKIELINEKK